MNLWYCVLCLYMCCEVGLQWQLKGMISVDSIQNKLFVLITQYEIGLIASAGVQ